MEQNIERVNYMEMRSWFLEDLYCVLHTGWEFDSARDREQGGRLDIGYIYYQFNNVFKLPIEQAMQDILISVIDTYRSPYTDDYRRDNHRRWIADLHEKYNLNDMIHSLPAEEAAEFEYDLKLFQVIPTPQAELIRLLPAPRIVTTTERATHKEILTRLLRHYYDYDRVKLAYQEPWPKDDHEIYHAYAAYQQVYQRPLEILMLEVLALALEAGRRTDTRTTHHQTIVLELLKKHDLLALLKQIPEDETQDLGRDLKIVRPLLYRSRDRNRMRSMKPETVLRDPAGSQEAYENYFTTRPDRKTWWREPSVRPVENRVARLFYDSSLAQEYMLHYYGRGDPLPDLIAQLRSDLQEMLEDFDIPPHEDAFDSEIINMRPIHGVERRGFCFTALAVLLLDQPDDLDKLWQLISLNPDYRSYLFDVLMKAFIPKLNIAKEYKRIYYDRPKLYNPVLRALCQPPTKRSALLALQMTQWCQWSRRYGWRPTRDLSPKGDGLFCDFAFEIALAVCAYDIDDSSFCDHPYYPRDLVDYYRLHIRNTRDRWRAPEVGAGITIVKPSPPKKADLAQSKRKQFARWVELVCDGDIEATETVIKMVGHLQNIQDFYQLVPALCEEVQHLIHARLGNAYEMATQMEDRAEAHGLGLFLVPEGLPYGGVMCRILVRSFSTWLAERDYCLVMIDNRDDEDAWRTGIHRVNPNHAQDCYAVLIKADYLEELLTLSQNLGLKTREANDPYYDN